MELLSFLNSSYKASTSLTVTAKIQENMSDQHKAMFGTCRKKKRGKRVLSLFGFVKKWNGNYKGNNFFRGEMKQTTYINKERRKRKNENGNEFSLAFSLKSKNQTWEKGNSLFPNISQV